MEDFVIIGPRAKLAYKYTIFCEYKDENGQLGLEPVATTWDKDSAQFMIEELRSIQDKSNDQIIDFFIDDDIHTRNVEVNEAFFATRGIDDLPFKKKVYDYEASKGRIVGVKK